MAGLAVFATTLRHLNDYRIPNIFLLLPSGLIVWPFLLKGVSALSDVFTRTAVIGVLTGVSCGFLSTVANIYRTQVLYMQNTQHKTHIQFAQFLEILHLPVIIIAIIDSFLRVFSRFPSPKSIQTAAVTALIADLIIIIYTMMLLERQLTNPEFFKLFVMVYIHLIMLACLPLFKETSRAWLLILCAMSAFIQWEVIGYGSAMWYWKRYSFPIPGCFIGLIYVFHSRGGFPREDLTRKPVLPVEMVRGPPDQSFHLTSLHWHGISFVFERIALHGLYGKDIDPDTVPACIIMIIHLFIMSPFFQSSKTVRVLATIGSLLSYQCYTLVNMQLANAYIFDIIIGMTLVTISNVSDKPAGDGLDVPKISIL